MSLAKKHPVHTDSTVYFDERPHKYYVNIDTLDNTHREEAQTAQGQEDVRKVNGRNYSKYGIQSVTEHIKNFLGGFDADARIDEMMANPNWFCSPYYGMSKQDIIDLWEKKRDTASDDGTAMHELIENYYNGKPTDPETTTRFEKEFKQFKKYQEEVFKANGKDMYRVEMRMFSPITRWSGTTDAVAVLGQKTLEDGTKILLGEIIDNKRTARIDTYPRSQLKFYINPNTYKGRAKHSGAPLKIPGDSDRLGKKVIKYGNGVSIRLPAKGKGPFRRCLDTKQNKFAAQAWTYAWMLETHYRNFIYKGERYDRFEIVQTSVLALHPERFTYEYMVLPDLSEEVSDMVMMRIRELEHKRLLWDDFHEPYHPLWLLAKEYFTKQKEESETSENMDIEQDIDDPEQADFTAFQLYLRSVCRVDVSPSQVREVMYLYNDYAERRSTNNSVTFVCNGYPNLTTTVNFVT